MTSKLAELVAYHMEQQAAASARARECLRGPERDELTGLWWVRRAGKHREKVAALRTTLQEQLMAKGGAA